LIEGMREIAGAHQATSSHIALGVAGHGDTVVTIPGGLDRCGSISLQKYVVFVLTRRGRQLSHASRHGPSPFCQYLGYFAELDDS